MIPALMVSVSGGMIVTRAGSDDRLGANVRQQVFLNAQPLLLAGGVLIAMAIIPGLPTVPFLLMGSGVGYLGWKIRQNVGATEKTLPAATPTPAKENLESLLKVEPLAVEIGLGLVKLVEGGQNSPLLRRIAGIRRQMATDLGYMVPAVRVTDNLQLKPSEYAVLLKGAEIARFELMQNHELAIHPASSTQPAASPTASAPQLPGTPTREPAFGIPAVWVAANNADQARAQGYTVVDTVSVLGTHLAELIRRHASELLSRQETKTIRGLCS